MPGTYSVPNSSVCAPCPPGEFSPLSGAGACTPCPPTTWSNAGAPNCSLCAAGYVNPPTQVDLPAAEQPAPWTGWVPGAVMYNSPPLTCPPSGSGRRLLLGDEYVDVSDYEGLVRKYGEWWAEKYYRPNETAQSRRLLQAPCPPTPPSPIPSTDLLGVGLITATHNAVAIQLNASRPVGVLVVPVPVQPGLPTSVAFGLSASAAGVRVVVTWSGGTIYNVSTAPVVWTNATTAHFVPTSATDTVTFRVDGAGFVWISTPTVLHAASTCSLCPSGSICDGGVSRCAPGTYSMAQGLHSQSQCATCPPGYFCTGGADLELCATGAYSVAHNLSSACPPCPANSYCPNATTIDACPNHTTSAARSTDLSQCLCIPGYQCQLVKVVHAEVTLPFNLSTFTAELQAKYIAAVAAAAGVDPSQVQIVSITDLSTGGNRRILGFHPTILVHTNIYQSKHEAEPHRALDSLAHHLVRGGMPQHRGAVHVTTHREVLRRKLVV